MIPNRSDELHSAAQLYVVRESVRQVVLLKLDSAFVAAHISRLFRRNPLRWRIHDDLQQQQQPPRAAHLQFVEYEYADWDAVLTGETRTRCSCYCVRKGLTRKAAWAQVVNKWIDRHGKQNVLAQFVPESIVVNTWDVFSDDGGWLAKFGIRDRKLALAEALRDVDDAFAAHPEGTLFILKPSISRKGAEVTPVSSTDQVKEIVLQWPDSREWVVQRYVPNLLLLDEGEKKFHLRVFIVCVGALDVFLFREYIGFFAASPFQANDKFSHITNAAHQREGDQFEEDALFKLPRELAELASKALNISLEQALHEFTEPTGSILTNLRVVIAEAFRALKTQTAVFQPHGNCFELFGLDFLVDRNLHTHLLEFNSGPDLDQARDNRLTPLIVNLIEGWFRLGVQQANHDERFVSCYSENWEFAKHAQQVLYETD